MSADQAVLSKWMRQAHKAGWRIRSTGRGHLRWINPAGQSVFTPSPPGKGRAMANTRAQLRRAGLRIEK